MNRRDLTTIVVMAVGTCALTLALLGPATLHAQKNDARSNPEIDLPIFTVDECIIALEPLGDIKPGEAPTFNLTMGNMGSTETEIKPIVSVRVMRIGGTGGASRMGPPLEESESYRREYTFRIPAGEVQTFTFRTEKPISANGRVRPVVELKGQTMLAGTYVVYEPAEAQRRQQLGLSNRIESPRVQTVVRVAPVKSTPSPAVLVMQDRLAQRNPQDRVPTSRTAPARRGGTTAYAVRP